MSDDGGLRDRFIYESLLRNVETELTSIGWFGASREHQPISIIDEFPNDDTPVTINTIAFSMGDASGFPLELGSLAEEHEQVIFVDIFAENDAVGRHIRGDIYEFLRKNPSQQVYDYRTDTPIFKVEVLNDIDKRKPDNVTVAWKKHWYVISFTVLDNREN